MMNDQTRMQDLTYLLKQVQDLQTALQSMIDAEQPKTELTESKDPEYWDVATGTDMVAFHIQHNTHKGEVHIQTNGLAHPDESFEDDNFIHIVRGKYKVCFFNGQEDGRYTEKDVARLSKRVENALKYKPEVNPK